MRNKNTYLIIFEALLSMAFLYCVIFVSDDEMINMTVREKDTTYYVSDVIDTEATPQTETVEIMEEEIPLEANVRETSVTEDEAVVEEKTATGKITISMAGDCALGKLEVHDYASSFWKKYDTKGEDWFFSGVKDIFEADNMTLVNLECVFTDSEDLVEKEFNIKGHKEYAGILTAGGIECVGFDNNHYIDYGLQGYEDTKKALEDEGITYAIGRRVATYTITAPEGSDARDIKVGYLSLSDIRNHEPAMRILEDDVEKLRKENVDVLIALFHYGEEGTHYPVKNQKELAHKAADLGVDLVVGTHAHLLQGVEYYNDTFIFYGMSNFCFGANRNPKNKESMILQATFDFDNPVSEEKPYTLGLNIIPCTISSREDTNDFQPTVVTGAKRQTILDHLNTYSKGMGVRITDEGDVQISD